MNDPDMQKVNKQSFKVDLNSLRDGNRLSALVGYFDAQLVPEPEDVAIAVDEDGACYDAVVESVVDNVRVYLRLNWASKRFGLTFPPVSYNLQLVPTAGVGI
jgi:hypothetical protein